MGYLAGVFDGEGSVGDSKMKFSQQDNACSKQAIAILEARGVPYRRRKNGAQQRGYEPCYGYSLFEGGVERKVALAIMRLLGQLAPPRLLEEQSTRVWEGKSAQIAGDVEVTGLRYVGEREVAGFTTSTATFVANGMLTHNTRGDVRKRHSAMLMPGGAQTYDTLLVGHFHQLLMLPRLIMNGSVKGYDEYALGINVPYEPPQQALWMVHPAHGHTWYLPVLCDAPEHRRVE